MDSVNSSFENTTNLNFEINDENNIFNKTKSEISSIINSTLVLRNNLNTILDLVNENFEDEENEYFAGFLNRYIRRISVNMNHSFDAIKLFNETALIIESINSFISQNKNIGEETSALKNYCNLKTNEIKQGILDSENRLNDANKNLEILLNKIVIFKEKVKNEIKEDIYEISKKYSEIYVYIVQIYFESLKFLRHNWYDYEVNYFLEEFGD
jgi:hypothetical protein